MHGSFTAGPINGTPRQRFPKRLGISHHPLKSGPGMIRHCKGTGQNLPLWALWPIQLRQRKHSPGTSIPSAQKNAGGWHYLRLHRSGSHFDRLPYRRYTNPGFPVLARKQPPHTVITADRNWHTKRSVPLVDCISDAASRRDVHCARYRRSDGCVRPHELGTLQPISLVLDGTTMPVPGALRERRSGAYNKCAGPFLYQVRPLLCHVSVLS